MAEKIWISRKMSCTNKESKNVLGNEQKPEKIASKPLNITRVIIRITKHFLIIFTILQIRCTFIYH